MYQRKLLCLLFTAFFLSSCGTEYWQFHDSRDADIRSHEEVRVQTETFSPEQIGEREYEILTTPDKKVLDRFVSLIDSAKREVDVEVYILTEKRIIKALQDAKARGVTVRVILEKNVFGGTSINTKAYKSLAGSGVNVAYASNDLYNFTHSKFLIADDIYLIATGNFSYASFANNREWYVIGQDSWDLKVLRETFSADFSHTPIVRSTTNLVISPTDSRQKIESLLRSTSSGILLYAETFDDPAISDILEGKRTKNIPVTICMASPKKIPSNTESIALLRARGIDVRTSIKPIIHAKAILADGRYAYIGSENFTTNSLDNNREIGTLFRADADFATRFTRMFYSDCPNRDR